MLILKIICSTLLGIFGLFFTAASILQIHTMVRDKKNFGFTNKGYLDPFDVVLCMSIGILIFAVIILEFI